MTHQHSDDDDGTVVPLRPEYAKPGTAVAIPDSTDLVIADYLEVEIVDDYENRQLAVVVVEHASYLVAGVTVVSRRVWESGSSTLYNQMIRAAQAVGDHENALEWEARRAEHKRDRHARTFDWIELPARILGVLPMLAAVFAAALLVFGLLLALATKDPWQIVKPVMWLAAAVHLTVILVTVLWLPSLLVIVTMAAVLLWLVGRNSAEAGDVEWLATSADPDYDIEIDETTIARALEALRIKQINDYLKQGLPLQFITTARRDGRGTHAVIRLPAGVPAELIARPNRRAQLASGLYRATKETWPTVGSEAGILDLWIADKGALAEGAGPYPLLDDGFVDVFQGVPYGRTLRGDPMVAPIIGRNTIVGGMPDQGKSSSARGIMTGCALDPTAELRIWVPDSNYDFQVFKRRCSRYVMGAEDNDIEQILEDLRELHAEIQTRGDLLVKYQEPEVTRKLASAGVGLHPLICLLEEAHVAIQHKTHGAEIGELLEQITKLGRKRAIHLIVSTQAPTKDSMPRGVTRNCSNGIAFAVGDHVANDALLGQGAYRGGHRATELIPGVDAGTALVKGFSGQRSEMVQAYFLSVRKDNDQVTPIIDRALTEIARRGEDVPGTHQPRAAIESRDLLDDLEAAVEGLDDKERVKLTDLAGLLRKVAPGWDAYRRMSGTDLRKELIGQRIRVYTTGNLPGVDPVDVRAAVTRASTDDLDEE